MSAADTRVQATSLLIAHPYKHHALHMVRGCLSRGLSVRYATPYYPKGMMRAATWLPGKIGRKAQGYRLAGIDESRVSTSSPASVKLRSLIGARDEMQFRNAYDQHVANYIRRGVWRARALVTLQDYMPASCAAAREQGLHVVSDQISNQSASAMARIRRHMQAAGMAPTSHDESANDTILGSASAVTYPSRYCGEGLSGRLRADASQAVIPYGVDGAAFGLSRRTDPSAIRVLARASTVRKGGHLLIDALVEYGARLIAAAAPRTLRVTLLGRLDPALKARAATIDRRIEFVDDDVAAADVPALMAASDLFIMPALSESLSLAALEAMRTGLPVILTPFCGVDLAEGGVTGLMIKDEMTSVGTVLLEAIERREEWPRWGTESMIRATPLSWAAYEARLGDFMTEIGDG